MKEISTRFDLKDSKSQIAMEGKEAIVLHSADEYQVKAVNDVFQQKLVKRGVPLKGLTYGAHRTRRRKHINRRSACSKASRSKKRANRED